MRRTLYLTFFPKCVTSVMRNQVETHSTEHWPVFSQVSNVRETRKIRESVTDLRELRDRRTQGTVRSWIRSQTERTSVEKLGKLLQVYRLADGSESMSVS